MKRSAWIIPFVLGLGLQNVSAQQADSVTDTQTLGRLLFEQSCGVCHTKPTLTSGLFGPALSKDSLGGREDVMRDVISEGTPQMPGFKHHFQRAQIDAIIAYMKSMPPQPHPA